MRILALNGGGTAGYASCLILQKLEQEVKQPCYELFDLIAGVSTGAIITGALGIGMSAATLVDLYQTDIPKIFTKPKWPFWRGYLGPAKYETAALEEMLSSVFKDFTLGQCKTDCMINATQIAPRVQPYFWKSWRSEGYGAMLKDIIRASSAAPTFFAPKTIGDRVFVDGAMAANNPSHCAIAEAIRLRAGLEEISLLNLQLGDAPTFSVSAAQKMRSILGWAPKLTPIFLSANVEISEYIATTLVADYINIDFNFPQPIDFWSEKFASDTRALVDQYWSVNRNRVVNAVLTGKKASPISTSETVVVPALQNDTKAEGSNGGNAVNPRADH